MEAALIGIPSVALSQVFTPRATVPWETAETYTPIVMAALLDAEWEPNSFVNVSFPDALSSEVTGTRVTRQGQRPPGSFRPEPSLSAPAVPCSRRKPAHQ